MAGGAVFGRAAPLVDDVRLDARCCEKSLRTLSVNKSHLFDTLADARTGTPQEKANNCSANNRADDYPTDVRLWCTTFILAAVICRGALPVDVLWLCSIFKVQVSGSRITER